MTKRKLLSLILTLTMLLSITAVGFAEEVTEVTNPDGTKTVTTVHDDGNITTEVFYKNGNLKSHRYEDVEHGYVEGYEQAEDGTILSDMWELPDNGFKSITTYKDGNPDIKTDTYFNGYQTITTYDEKGDSITKNLEGEIVGEEKTHEDGSRTKWQIDSGGDKWEEKYDKDYNQISSMFLRTDGHKEFRTFKDGEIDTETITYPDGYQEITTYDENGDSITKNSDGNIVGEGKTLEDGTHENWSLSHDDGYISKEIYKKDELVQETIIAPSGYQEITTYDENGGSVTTDAQGKVIGESKILEDGGEESWSIDTYGDIRENKYDKYGNRLSSKFIYADGSTQVNKYEKGTLKTITSVDAEGYKTISTYAENGDYETKDTEGNVVGWQKTYEDGSKVDWSKDKDGTEYEYKYDKERNYLGTKKTKPDGSVEIGTKDEDGNRVTKDKDGNLIDIETTEPIKNDKGEPIGKKKVKKDANGKVLGEWYYDEESWQVSSWHFDEDGNKIVYERDDEAKLHITKTFDPAGNLIEEQIVDFAYNLVSLKKFESEEAKKPKFVWYPSNTTSTHGLAFREERPELTDKWYRFTPLDLSQDGTTNIPLIGGSVYIVGTVTIDVKGDEVVVNYSYKGTPYDTARAESEYLNLLPDLASLESLELEDLGEGFKFGEPISIEKDLEGDTKVLLFVRNELTFRDYWRGESKLSRHWPNSENYAKYYEYLRSIMD
ncbi:MAG: hypothetical protein Q4E07_06285 [Eubacteriales bacterium]|nr:hypothetical protein [Eubacteriales bacterium]